MGRYANSVGGWFRLWSRQWLNDEKIQSLSDAEQGQLVRIISVANECLSGGRFEVIGIALTVEQVAEKARVNVSFLDKLTTLGITQNTPFSIKNWEKWQNPEGKGARELREPIPMDLRIKVAIKSGGKCKKCGADKNLHVDHIIPVDAGGSTKLDNLQLLCVTCNNKKGNKIPDNISYIKKIKSRAEEGRRKKEE